MSHIYRRTVTDGVPGPWEIIGTTCYPNTQTPRNPAGSPQPPPVLTPGMIREEWINTPFSKAVNTIQPPRQATLVTLPIYLTTSFPSAGFEPGETRTVDIVGFSVRIQPTLVGFRHTYGDGTVQTTTSRGGPWPDGDVRHAYDRPGSYAVRTDTVYGGKFSVNGGDWVDIDGTVTVTGTPQTIRVLTARNRLTK